MQLEVKREALPNAAGGLKRKLRSVQLVVSKRQRFSTPPVVVFQSPALQARRAAQKSLA